MEKPRIPMLPGELPQQRLTSVESLPERPDDFRSRSVTEALADGEYLPRDMPESAVYLCSLEWAWGPMNESLCGYYLSEDVNSGRWLLWTLAYDDNWSEWIPMLQRAANRLAVVEKDAAMLLLRDFLVSEAERCGLDKYDWNAEEGLLDSSDVESIARTIWDSSHDDDSGHVEGDV